ncbi:hypothetical protein Pcinc_014344 [Petrolisthes cinctipes]|uniref:Uncharacterized protein n=1 Tax=Petrolisthes cinctipes TaxID=88211 RepID=A0AAE1KTC5_PETCI|nr:hypothetical protein Pcinc_014344 [Petrolisthes cinctipes]
MGDVRSGRCKCSIHLTGVVREGRLQQGPRTTTRHLATTPYLPQGNAHASNATTPLVPTANFTAQRRTTTRASDHNTSIKTLVE